MQVDGTMHAHVQPVYCGQECSLSPTVLAVAGEAESASAHAAPALAGRSPSVSQGIGGHPESESVTHKHTLETQNLAILKTG